MAASHTKFVETQEDEHSPDVHALAIYASPEQLPPLFATVSFSQSLSTVLASHFFRQTKVAAAFSFSAASVRFPPNQASSLSNLSLSAFAAPSPSRISFRSAISANPLQSPLTLGPHRPLDPSGAAGLRRAAVVWFRNDLRLHDNECLASANNESLSVLPVYCFDPRDYGKSSSGFDKTGPFRASFVIDSVSDLRRNLQSRGSDLVVRVGKPEEVLVEMAKAVGADAVYAHSEVSREEVKAEERVGAAMKEEGVEMKYFWGSTLFHIDDMPFKMKDMPMSYGGFKVKVQGLEVRKTVAASDNLKDLPKRGDVEPGEIPTLLDLGVSPSASMAQDGKAASMVGGETEAMHKLKKFAAECQAQPNKGANENNVYGANFSCKISPWLTNGCISPRAMFEELKSTATNVISASSKKSNGGDDGSSGTTGSNWLMYELLWRDFFRFITKKSSSAMTPANSVPVCAGAAA